MLLCERLADVAHGGQVLMSEEAWQGVQDLLQAFPNAAYAINLGLHAMHDDCPKPRYLMEVMPTLMAGRSFKPPATRMQLELGYREAPGVHEPMAMVFIKVRVAGARPPRGRRRGCARTGAWQQSHAHHGPRTRICAGSASCAHHDG